MAKESSFTRSRRFRILLLAEAANPEWTSVPLVGWNLSSALAKIADVHLVTQFRNKEALQRKGLQEGTEFTAIDNEFVAARLHAVSRLLGAKGGKGWTMGAAFSSLSYYSFEREVWAQFKDRLRSKEFDVVHRITPVSPTSQSILAGKLAKLDVPFIVGPLNGGVPWPPGFKHRQFAEREWLSDLRRLYKLMPGYRAMRKYSSAIISGSEFTLSDMPQWCSQKSIYIPENGIDPELFNKPRQATGSLPLHAAFVGRFVPYKGADILIDAAAPFLRQGTLKLHLIGDGPQRALLESKVRQLDILDAVIFHGWVAQSELREVLSATDFLAFPSIREFGGGVVLEAMALGLTPIVADYGGPAELVEEDTGIRVPFSDEASLIAGFREAIAKVINSPSLLVRYGVTARERVLQTFTWDAKAAQISNIYSALLDKTPDLRSLGLHRPSIRRA